MRMWRLTYGEVNIPVKLNQCFFFSFHILQQTLAGLPLRWSVFEYGDIRGDVSL